MQSNRFRPVVALAAISLTSVAHAQTPHATTRGPRLHRVRPGITMEQVARIAGPADDVWTEADHPGTWLAGVVVCWAYGGAGHRAYPTQGEVCFDAARRVRYVFPPPGA